jgi:hypothetical protein
VGLSAGYHLNYNIEGEGLRQIFSLLRTFISMTKLAFFIIAPAEKFRVSLR